MAAGRYQLVDRYLADSGAVFLTGLQALARLPLEQLRADRRAGLNTAALISGYPGSPLGGYDVTVASVARLAPDLPVICRPAMNEEYAASAVMGSQLAAAQPDCLYDGIVGIWYGKSPGVDRATDALRHAVYAGTSMHGGAVAIVGDDPAAKSSTLPSSSAGALADMHMPVLYPGDPAEALDLGRHAIAMSRATGLWSALKIVADVADATASVHLHPERIVPVMPRVDGELYRHRPDAILLAPFSVEREREIYEVRYELARQYAAENGLNVVAVDPPTAALGIVASGITYREVREAFTRLGVSSDDEIRSCGIRLLKMGMPLPFDAGTIRSFARGLREVFVIEEKQPNIEGLIKDALYGLADRPLVVGKTDELGEPLVPGHGALDADILVPILRGRIEARVGVRLAAEEILPGRALAPLSVQRTPFFCSGCPHNRSTEVPEGSLVGAGIGCHTMVMLMDPERIGSVTGVACMGNEGTQWIGMSDFVARKHFVQNLGDGTYFHSGQLAIQAAVAANVNITFKLLYNGTVAMTGGQHPQGQLAVPDVARILRTQGVARVLITTEDTERYRDAALPSGVEVWDRKRLMEAQHVLAETPGVTVLIHDQGCAAEARRLRKRGKIPTPDQRVVINHRICEGCGHCGEVSNCLSVQPIDTPFGRKTEIDQTTCNLDFSCLEGDCPSFMTITPKKRQARRARREEMAAVRAQLPEPPIDLPDPARIVPDDEFALRITGIGGTGVVTVAQVLGTAAMLDGYHVRGLDQIGLSQKAGPVVSDLRLSRSQPTATNRLGEGQADLLLAFDQLVAASERGLLVADPSRTAVVGSTSPTPTGEMITHPGVRLPSPGDLTRRIAGVTRGDAQHWADAFGITEDLFGRATTANIFVVGMAYQSGCLPISAKHIEEAIGLNATAVEANLAAFRWGRAQIAAPQAVTAARRVELGDDVEVVESAHVVPDAIAQRIAALGPPAFQAALTRYAAELCAWQSARTARAWLEVLERVSAREREVSPDSTRLLEAIAANLFKLTAYKDEYEVARLMTDADGLAAAREVAGKRGKIAWRLHPPILRAIGLSHKIAIPGWMGPAVRLLAKGKHLRGTPLDPFGYTHVRRIERALPGEYVASVDRVLSKLSAANLDAAVKLAELPDLVRGYEEIKVRRVEDYRQRLREALSAFE
ncbi:MAG TPA: indolepyruvate ferredoxin oxidoreductase family protein [Myxococcota bacterium]|nr:indolepyruvate ferredoxin oxidoreductase family protein [Myxococcota bacterium]